MDIQYNTLTVEGVIFNPSIEPQLKKGLENVAIGKKLNRRRASFATKPGERAFAYQMKIKRGL